MGKYLRWKCEVRLKFRIEGKNIMKGKRGMYFLFFINSMG